MWCVCCGQSIFSTRRADVDDNEPGEAERFTVDPCTTPTAQQMVAIMTENGSRLTGASDSYNRYGFRTVSKHMGHFQIHTPVVCTRRECVEGFLFQFEPVPDTKKVELWSCFMNI